MRILHVANFNLKKYGADFYATDRKISAGLIRCGHAVYDFSYRDICRSESPLRTTRFGGAGLNRKLIKACDNLQPDILLLGHSELITKETLVQIRHSHPTMRVGLWYVDALFHREKASHILTRRELIDVLFATTGGELLKEYGPGGSRTAFIPNMVDNSVETGQAFARTNWDYDFLFCGRDGNDIERRAFIQKLYNDVSSFLHPTFRGCLGQPPLTGAAYIELLSQTRMGLNLSRRNDVYLYSSDRLAQLLGNGLLTFCPRIPGMERLFSQDELVYFDNFDDLLKKLRHFHENVEESCQIAKKGWQKTHQYFNSEKVSRYMVEMLLEKPLSEEYGWLDND